MCAVRTFVNFIKPVSACEHTHCFKFNKNFCCVKCPVIILRKKLVCILGVWYIDKWNTGTSFSHPFPNKLWISYCLLSSLITLLTVVITLLAIFLFFIFLIKCEMWQFEFFKVLGEGEVRFWDVGASSSLSLSLSLTFSHSLHIILFGHSEGGICLKGILYRRGRG